MKNKNLFLLIVILVAALICISKNKGTVIGKNIEDVGLSCSARHFKVDDFHDGLAYVGTDENSSMILHSSKGYYIDKNGKIILNNINTLFEHTRFSEGLAPIVKHNLSGFQYGYINKKGKTVIKAKYSLEEEENESADFKEGLTAVTTDDSNGVGYINKKGEVVIDFQFYRVKEFSEELAAVKKGGDWGYIDKTGKFVMNYQYEDIKSFSEGLAAVKKGGKWGFIDKQGNLIIDYQYEDIKSFSEDLAAVKKEGKWGFIDKKGNLIVDYQYEDVESFKEGLAAVEKEDWGYIDKQGNIIIDYQYGIAKSFSEGFAAVFKGDWGYIDKQGNSITSFTYRSANDFSEGLAGACYDSCYCVYIDQSGQEIIHIKEKNK